MDAHVRSSLLEESHSARGSSTCWKPGGSSSGRAGGSSYWVPCRPTPADLRGVAPTLAAIHRLEKDFAFVLNQTPPKSYRVRDTAEGLKVLGMLAEVNVVMRNDHQDAIKHVHHE